MVLSEPKKNSSGTLQKNQIFQLKIPPAPLLPTGHHPFLMLHLLIFVKMGFIFILFFKFWV